MKSQLTKFIIKTMIYAVTSFGILFAVMWFIDPLQLFRYHDDYFKDGFQPNKGTVSLRQYEHFAPYKKFDSFIVGSSLAINYHIDDWKKYLPTDSRPFHFDSSAQSVLSLQKFIEYLCEHSDTIRHVLIPTSPKLIASGQKSGIPFVDPPKINPAGTLDYYNAAFREMLYRKFLYGYIAWRTVGRPPRFDHRLYLSEYQGPYYPEINEETTPQFDTLLAEDPEAFHRHFNYVFTKGPARRLDSVIIDTEKEKALRAVADALRDKNADFRFVLGPNTEHIQLSCRDDSLLCDIFGDRYYNLVGQLDSLAGQPQYWYDPTHYSPEVCRRIMHIVYNSKP